MSQEGRTCHACGRPLAECVEPVDARFPPEALAAYALGNLSVAKTCPQGQAFELRHVGWCWDRARFNPEWRGDPLKESERRGVGR